MHFLHYNKKNYWVLFHWKWLLWVWLPIIAFPQKTIPILLTRFKKFLFIQFLVTFVIFGTTHLYSHTFHVFVVLVHSCFNGKLCHEYIIRFEIMRIDYLKNLYCALIFWYIIEQILAYRFKLLICKSRGNEFVFKIALMVIFRHGIFSRFI